MSFVRAIAADDWQAYRRVRLSALKDSPQAFGSAWETEAALPDEDWAARCLASAVGQSGRGFFAFHGNEICGLSWCLLSDTDLRIANVYSMWVAPAVRGLGVGRELLEQCIAWAQNKGVHHVHLSVAKGQVFAQSLYKSRGFYPIGEPHDLRFGSDVKTQQMQLDCATCVDGRSPEII